MRRTTIIVSFVLFLLTLAYASEVEVGEKIFFVSKELMEWKEVATFCVRPEFNNRFRIAKILKQNENNEAAKTLKRVNDATGEELDGWLGGYHVNGWTWGDNSAVKFTGWGANHPKKNKNCMYLRFNAGKGVWYSGDCTEKKRAICQAFSFSKVYDFIERTKEFNKTEAVFACSAIGGGLATILSPAENKAVEHQISTVDVPPSAFPTRKPTKKQPTSPPTKKEQLPCCKGGAKDKCCFIDAPPPQIPCNCKCCCCKQGSNFRKCCAPTKFQMCGCDAKPTKAPTRQLPNTAKPTRKPTTRAPTKPTLKPTRTPTFPPLPIIFRVLGGNEQQKEIPGNHDINRRSTADGQVRVFLNAFNEKVAYVKEENASFVWSNGISFKPIGYLPPEVSKPFTNWATYPFQRLNDSCIILNGFDGKWQSIRCDSSSTGAVCEIRIIKKQFQLFTHQTMSESDAASFCAAVGGQLASIKTEKERKQAIAEIKQQHKKCGKCVQDIWVSGIQIGGGDTYYWLDGQLFYRDGAPIGLKKGFKPDSPVGECVGIKRNGDLVRQACESLLYPMCEFRTKDPPAAQPQPPADKCFPGCLPAMRGDGQCDAVCNHYTCGFDNDDCGQCAEGCPYHKLSNGVCDPECFNATCAFDAGDCFSASATSRRLISIEPAIALAPAQAHDDKQELAQDSTSVRRLETLDLPLACNQTSDSCNPLWIGDKYCDVIACGRECDQQDCQQVASVETCSKTCRNADLFNDRCDKGCASLDCNFDGGLCPVACDAACGDSIVLNSCTAPACDVPKCRYDIGRCRDSFNPALRCSPACDSRFLGNGRCDAACNNKACKWDAGDCPEADYCPYPVPFDEYGCIDQCNKPLYKFQRGACENTCLTTECTAAMLGNGVCDEACNNPSCGMDAGDCEPCAPACNPFELNNGFCSSACNTTGCGFDGGDCVKRSPL